MWELGVGEHLGVIATAFLMLSAIIWIIVSGIVPPTDPMRCRIMTRFQKATGKIRGPGITWVWLKGLWQDFVEEDRRFEIQVPEFELQCPDRIPFKASPVLLVELITNGGNMFILNGGREGISRKISYIVRSRMQEFAANPNGKPQDYLEAMKMANEFVFEALDDLVVDVFDVNDRGEYRKLTVRRDAIVDNREREKFVDELVERLAENECAGCGYRMIAFGLKVIGFNMGKFTEDPTLAASKSDQKAQEIANQVLQMNIDRFAERVETLKKTAPAGTSFNDIARMVLIKEKVIDSKTQETVIRMMSGDGNITPEDKTLVSAQLIANGLAGNGKKGGS